MSINKEITTINVLGTEYTIVIRKISDDQEMKNNQLVGYCSGLEHKIIISDLNEKEYFPNLTDEEKDRFFKETLRHEIIHAHLNESGLKNCTSSVSGPWSKNEEMVDWIAIQFPKLLNVFMEANCL